MNIVDTATVSAFLIVFAVAVIATVVTFGVVVWRWAAASRPAWSVRVRPAAVAVPKTTFAH